MYRRPQTNPRKHAAQRRSRATVAALIEATARILVSEGFDKASTNRIAERAGVSIGSLYQYFPSKEALVAAVIDRHNEKVMKLAMRALADVAAQPLEISVRRLVEVAIEAHRIDPKLHRVLAEQLPRSGRLENVEIFNRTLYDLFRAYLTAHRDEIRPVDPELAAYVCVTSIEAISHNAVLHHAEVFSDRGFDSLVDEAALLIVRYLL